MEPSLIVDEVCVQADVKVSPDVKIKDIKTCIAGDPVIEEIADDCAKCSYSVSQLFSVKYSLSFSADVQAAAAGISCCNPQIKEYCEEQDSRDAQAAPAEAAAEPAADEFPDQASGDMEPAPAEAAVEPAAAEIPDQASLDVEAAPAEAAVELAAAEIPDQASLDAQEAPEAAGEPKADEQQADVEPSQTDEIKKPSPLSSDARIYTDRKISIPKKYLAEFAFYRSLTSQSRKH